MKVKLFIKIDNEYHSREVQEYLFSMGILWTHRGTGTNNIRHCHSKYLVVKLDDKYILTRGYPIEDGDTHFGYKYHVINNVKEIWKYINADIIPEDLFLM